MNKISVYVCVPLLENEHFWCNAGGVKVGPAGELKLETGINEFTIFAPGTWTRAEGAWPA